MKIDVKKVTEEAILPRDATPESAGADLYALPGTDVTLQSGQTALIRTGIAMAIPAGYAGFVYARSGLATRQGLAPANKVGVIDADYRGEILVSLFNQSGEDRTVQGGDRIAQLVIAPVLQGDFFPVQTLKETERGTGGFGSTGK